MSFTPIVAGTRFLREAVTNRVAVSQGSDKSGLMVVISGDVYKKIGEPPFVRLLIGSGQHSGLVAIVPVFGKTEGVYTIVRTKNAKRAQFGIMPSKIGVVSRKRSITPVSFELTDDGLVVDLRALNAPMLQAAE